MTISPRHWVYIINPQSINSKPLSTLLQVSAPPSPQLSFSINLQPGISWTSIKYSLLTMQRPTKGPQWVHIETISSTIILKPSRPMKTAILNKITPLLLVILIRDISLHCSIRDQLATLWTMGDLSILMRRSMLMIKVRRKLHSISMNRGSFILLMMTI